MFTVLRQATYLYDINSLLLLFVLVNRLFLDFIVEFILFFLMFTFLNVYSFSRMFVILISSSALNFGTISAFNGALRCFCCLYCI